VSVAASHAGWRSREPRRALGKGGKTVIYVDILGNELAVVTAERDLLQSILRRLVTHAAMMGTCQEVEKPIYWERIAPRELAIDAFDCDTLGHVTSSIDPDKCAVCGGEN
jgi:hypothetical protein